MLNVEGDKREDQGKGMNDISENPEPTSDPLLSSPLLSRLLTTSTLFITITTTTLLYYYYILSITICIRRSFGLFILNIFWIRP